MYNIFKSFFARDIYVTQNVIINSTIITLIQTIRKSFFEGNISSSLKSLEDAFKEYDGKKEIMYHLLVLKALFFLNLKKKNELEKIITLLEEEYIDFHNIGFCELKINILSGEKDSEDEYNKFVDKVVAQINQPIEYFNAVRQLNLGNHDSALSIITTLENIQNEMSNKCRFLKGLIYIKNFNEKIQNSKIFKENESYVTAKCAFFQFLKEECHNKNIYNNLDIHMNLVFLLVNKYVHNINITSNDEEEFQQYDDVLADKLIDNIEEFDKEYSKIILSYLLITKLALGKTDEYTEIAEKYYNLLDSYNFLIFHIKKKDLDKIKVINYYRTHNDIHVIEMYITNLINRNKYSEILDVCEENPIFLEDDIMFKQYIEASIICKIKIKDEHIERIVNCKNNSIFTMSNYISVMIYNSNKVEKEDIDTFCIQIKKRTITSLTLQNSLDILLRLELYDNISEIIDFHLIEYNDLLDYLVKWQISNKKIPYERFNVFFAN